MPTTVTIQDDWQQDLRQSIEAATNTAALNTAVAEWLRLRKRQEIQALRGSLPIEGDLSALRAMELREGSDG